MSFVEIVCTSIVFAAMTIKTTFEKKFLILISILGLLYIGGVCYMAWPEQCASILSKLVIGCHEHH